FFDIIARKDPRFKEEVDRRRQIRQRHRRIAKLEAEYRREKARPQPSEAKLRSLRRRIAEEKYALSVAKKFHRYSYPLVISLDISSRGPKLASFQAGWFFHDDHLMRFFSPLGKYLVEVCKSARLEGLFPFVDAINPTQERDWETYLPVRVAFDSEAAVRFGLRAITLATAEDERPLFDTPHDTLRRLDLRPVVEQARTVALLVGALCDERELERKPLKRLKRLPYRLKPIEGMVYEFEREESFLPSTPVPGCVVVVAGLYKVLGGVRPEAMDISDEAGEFRIRGVQGYAGLDFYKNSVLEAYKIDPETGDITYAPDLGIDGEKRYPRDVTGRVGLRRPLMVFRCRAIDIYDLVDPRYLETLEQGFVFDATTDAEPLSWGLSLPVAVPMGTMGGAPPSDPSYVEPCAVAFAPPGQAIKVGFSMGLLGLRMILLNSTPKKPEGIGFKAGRVRAIPMTSLQAAKDMWMLNESRLRLQARHGIVNQRVHELHRAAKKELERAERALRERDYETAVASARRAWAFESRAYPDVQGTSIDVIKGILFYLMLLLPFAFFAERLLFAFPDIYRRIAGTAVIFVAIFWLLRLVHPAFELGVPSLIILLGFVVLALALIVIAIVSLKFNEQLKRMQREMMGVHEQDVGRISAVATAFSLGLANMRRRKTRTALTATTIILLTFTVISFTSVRALLRAMVIPLRKEATYRGLMVRDRTWEAMEEPALMDLKVQLGRLGVVVGRAWLVSPIPEKRMVIDIIRGEKSYAVHALVGLSPKEPEVTGIDKALVAGRWFAEGERDACILPEEAAEALGAKVGEVVLIRGRPLKVVGIYDSRQFGKVLDLDGEPLTPIDYAALRPEQLRALRELAAQKFRLGRVSAAGILEEYTHYSPSDVAILPEEELISMGGSLRSVACRLDERFDPERVARRLVRLLALPIYTASGERVKLYSSLGLTTMSGLSDVFVPMVIAGLIVLNTMLGAVYERTREIGTFSAIGLAPSHIASFFLAEATVFAVIGAVVGYLLGQAVGKLVVAYNLLPGIYLNYSSVSAVASTLIVMLVVLLSTIYPARKASQIAVPAIERKWRL
ncbi:MAG TPA: ABC transporter permease, partial [Armatimonadetes bacterium]|nr:ABC transporter permease [Armatimonadota bacterium]